MSLGKTGKRGYKKSRQKAKRKRSQWRLDDGKTHPVTVKRVDPTVKRIDPRKSGR